MSHNKTNIYDVEPHIAEVYDQIETFTDDVELLQDLIGKHNPLRILEPFCGTGRILIPLANDGHSLVGLDQARGLLDCAHEKITQLSDEVQRRITLVEADVTTDEWPKDFDLVILGGNCLYELATPEEQERCITCAVTSLKSGGHVYLDNDHMEGDLDSSWQQLGVKRQAFPTGRCIDSTFLESYMETIWFDAPQRLVRFRRFTKVTLPNGNTVEKEYIQQKHPVSAIEIQIWLSSHDFVVEQMYGDRLGSPYEKTSQRVIFWAKKR